MTLNVVSRSGMVSCPVSHKFIKYRSGRKSKYMKDTQQVGKRDGPVWLSAYPNLRLFMAFSSLLWACLLEAPGSVHRTTCFPIHLYPIKDIHSLPNLVFHPCSQFSPSQMVFPNPTLPPAPLGLCFSLKVSFSICTSNSSRPNSNTSSLRILSDCHHTASSYGRCHHFSVPTSFSLTRSLFLVLRTSVFSLVAPPGLTQ